MPYFYVPKWAIKPGRTVYPSIMTQIRSTLYVFSFVPFSRQQKKLKRSRWVIEILFIFFGYRIFVFCYYRIIVRSLFFFTLTTVLFTNLLVVKTVAKLGAQRTVDATVFFLIKSMLICQIVISRWDAQHQVCPE